MSKFPQLTIVLGGVLVAIGALAFFVFAEPDPDTGEKSITALIPAFFGILFAGLGSTALKFPAKRKGVMHGALVLAVLALAGTATALPKLPAFLSDREGLVEEYVAAGKAAGRVDAIPVQSLVAVLMLVYLVVGIASFVAARKSGAAPAAD